MATATKSAKPTHKPVAKQHKGSLDYLQMALDDLGKARTQVQKTARGNIDEAVDRIRDAVQELRGKAAEPARDFEERLEHMSEEARRELGKKAIQAQKSPEALAELSKEIRHRKAALTA
jgi:hypothetical protein